MFLLLVSCLSTVAAVSLAGAPPPGEGPVLAGHLGEAGALAERKGRHEWASRTGRGDWTWVPVPAGQGWIGIAEDGNGAKKVGLVVHFAEGFEMLETEVTNRQYARLVPAHPLNDNKPVVWVSWMEARDWCQRAGGRLPTEVEWEYAARAGGDGAFGKGKRGEAVTEAELRRYPWFAPSVRSTRWSHAHRVKRKQSNAWGLYDIWGNVWEWTADPYKGSTLAGMWAHRGEGGLPGVTYPGPVDVPGDEAAIDHVYRGGAAWNGPWLLRSGHRYPRAATSKDERLGFRCVRVR